MHQSKEQHILKKQVLDKIMRENSQIVLGLMDIHTQGKKVGSLPHTIYKKSTQATGAMAEKAKPSLWLPVPTSHMGTGLCPECSTFDPAP